MPSDINSPEQCLKAIDVIEKELNTARKSLLNNETCVVNRVALQAQLEYLKDHLPDTVSKAAEIVKNEETIRKETEQKRTEILENASVQSQNMINEASQKAQQIMEQANYQASAMMERANRDSASCMEAAKAEAQRTIAEAEKQADKLVEEESIVRRARVESDELLENARQEATALHNKTLDYMDSLLADTDRKMSELINSIRLERNEIRNRR